MKSLRMLCIGMAMGLVGVLLSGFGASAQVLFELRNFPGGTLKVTYLMTRRQDDGTALKTFFTTEIVRNLDGTYNVFQTFLAPGQALEGLTTGMTRAAQAAAAGFRFQEGAVADIDLTPLNTPEERGGRPRPGQTYYLPDGAHLRACCANLR